MHLLVTQQDTFKLLILSEFGRGFRSAFPVLSRMVCHRTASLGDSTPLPNCEAVAYRRPAGADHTRPVDEICSLELLALARALADQSLVGEDLLYAMAQELGLSKVSASTGPESKGVLPHFHGRFEKG